MNSHEREVGLGTHMDIYDLLLISFDGVKILEKKGFDGRLGAEVLHANTGLSFRGGVHYNTSLHFESFSLGAGWSIHKIGLMYAYQSERIIHTSLHSLTLRVFF